MGVNTLDALAIGGGCPLLYALHIAKGHLFASGYFQSPATSGIHLLDAPCSCSLSPASPLLLPSWQIFRQSGQNRAKVNKFLVWLGVFSGFWETTKGKI